MENNQVAKGAKGEKAPADPTAPEAKNQLQDAMRKYMEAVNEREREECQK